MTNGDNILEQELLKQETSDKTVVQLGLMLGNKIEITVEKKLMNVLFCKGCVPSLKKILFTRSLNQGCGVEK